MRNLKIIPSKFRSKFRSKKTQLFLLLTTASLIILGLGIKLAAVGPGEIAMARLQESINAEPYCHELCAAWRQKQENIVVTSLKSGSRKSRRRLEKFWFSDLSSADFKSELLRIMRLSYGPGNPPDFIKEYLERPNTDVYILGQIIDNFGGAAMNNQNLKSNLRDIIVNDTSSEYKIEAIRTLSTINNDEDADEYFNIINGETETGEKIAAIRALGAVKNKRQILNIGQLDIIKRIIFDLKSEPKIRRELVNLLGDYYLVYPKETILIWQDIYKDSAIDSISRSFSADNLNHLNGSHLDMPAVSSSEWADYYNE